MFGQKMDVPSTSDGISVLRENIKNYLWLENTGNTSREKLNIAKDLRFGNVKAHICRGEVLFSKSLHQRMAFAYDHIYIAL